MNRKNLTLVQQRLLNYALNENVYSLKFNYVGSKMNFIEKFLAYTDDCESPTSFFQWSAISALSTVMRDNVFLHWGQLKIYPNLYVMLLAKSGTCRKGLPLKKVNELIGAIDNTKIIEGRSSIQGVIAELARDETGPKGFVVKKGACGLLYAEEFAASLVNDPAVITILTDIFDYRNTYNVILRDSVVTLKNVCFGMLVATNATMLSQVYNQAAIEGGLFGRTIVIHEKKRRKKNSMVFATPQTEENKKPLLDHLRALSQIRGEVETTKEARVLYHDWYNALDDEVEDKTGFMPRVHIHAAKIAMILAASDESIIETKKIVVTEVHIATAIELIWKIKENQKAITLGQGRSTNSEQMAIFLSALAKSKNNQATRRDILKKHFSDFDHLTLDIIVKTLEGAGLIKTTSILNEEGYQLTPVAITQVMNHEIEQKQKLKAI